MLNHSAFFLLSNEDPPSRLTVFLMAGAHSKFPIYVHLLLVTLTHRGSLEVHLILLAAIGISRELTQKIDSEERGGG